MSEMISVVKDFNPRPFGRYPEDGPANGQVFREKYLIPALDRNKDGSVLVDLTGYNRYGPSFLDEAFGGLIREGYKLEDLKMRLKIKHDFLEIAVKQAWTRIRESASQQ